MNLDNQGSGVVPMIGPESGSEAIRAALDALVPDVAPLALLDFPNHANVGDSAIWLGELAYLRRCRPACRIVWVSGPGLARWGTLPMFAPGTLILINGGGNLGDIWPLNQAHRERVVAHYHGHRVVQLPQSIHFSETGAEARCAEVFRAHPDFHLLTRDYESRAIGERLNPGRTTLCPDMALFLNPFRPPIRAQADCLALLRSDGESTGSRREAASGAPHWMRIVDWLEEPTTAMARLDRFLDRYPMKARRFRPWVYGRLARQRVRRGARLLAAGRVVVTDRLHAHLLCCLMGIPHVVLDNSYGKIAHFRAAWGTGGGLCQVATSWREACDTAQLLLAKG